MARKRTLVCGRETNGLNNQGVSRRWEIPCYGECWFMAMSLLMAAE